MRRAVSLLLTFVLLLGVLPQVSALPSEAEEVSTGFYPSETGEVLAGRHPAESVEYDSLAYQTLEAPSSQATFTTNSSFTYQDMTSSQNLIDLIKDCEGFSSTPYWDVSQYSIGYGTVCGYSADQVPSEYWNGISEAKGQELLMEYLEDTAEAEVNRFYRRIGRQPLQREFDAVVDFTYALGSSWMYEDSRVKAYLTNPTSVLDLMRAFGAWCRVDGKVNTTTCNRRIREALIYAYGNYLRPYGGVPSDLPVVEDGDLPVFKYVIFDGNGTTMINTRTDDVFYYIDGLQYEDLPVPTRSGYVFAGWERKDGSLLLDGHRITENLRVKARWEVLPYWDIQASDWYATSVAYCYKRGIMLGTTVDTFTPYGSATRGMVITVLYRMAGSPAVSGTCGLKDVDGSEAYFTEAVIWAVKNGVAAGYKDGSFRPNQPVTRAEMLTFLYRYAKNKLGADVSAEDKMGAYVDRDEVPTFAVDALNWALSRKMIVGTSTNPMTLSPRDTATRAQLAKMMMMLDNLE